VLFDDHEQSGSSYSLQGNMTGELKVKDTFVCLQLACDSLGWRKYVVQALY
jgi:hypothetical protein